MTNISRTERGVDEDFDVEDPLDLDAKDDSD